MPATVETHLTALFGALNGSVSVSGVTIAYYDFEPPTEQMQRPVAITVSWVETTPDFFRFRVRIYADAGQDAKRASTLVRLLHTAANALIPDEFGPSAWRSDLTEEEDAYVAEAIFEAGREDF